MPISATDLNKAYLAYFGRPADLTGKTYFATLEQADVIKAFDASAESTGLYGTDVAAKVNAIYMNLFNREAEPAGLTYWTTLITQGRVTAAEAALSILNGAQGTDATAVSNKLAAAEAFVAAMDTTAELVGYSGMDAAASARTWLKTVNDTEATLTAAVAGAQAAVTAAVAQGTGEGGAGYQLTNGTDVASANVFTAGQVYTPGGNDRINSLQDEDRLTGTGANPTLNATLGNAGDNGATVITPKLIAIETLNVAFTGSGGTAVTDIDLQDATGLNSINVTRVTQASNTAEVGNVKQAVANMSIASSNANNAGTVEISFENNTLAGSNTGALTLSDVQLGTVNVGQNTSGIAAVGVGTRGYEDLTINSTGATNSVGTFNLPMDTGTAGKITVTGDENLTIATSTNVLTIAGSTRVEAVTHGGGIAQNAGRLASIDASALEGSLTLNIQAGLLSTGKAGTSGQAQNVTITGSKNADTFYLSDTVQAGDVIDGNDGTDTLFVYTGGVTTGTVSKVENVNVQMTSGVTLDLDKMLDTATLTVRNIDSTAALAADNGDWTTTLNNLSAAQGAALVVEHSTTNNGAIIDTTIQANLKSSTNAADLVAVEIKEGINTDVRFNFTLATNADVAATAGIERVENITLTDSDSESNSVELNSFAGHTGTITLKGGSATTFLNLDVDTAEAVDATPALDTAKATYDAAPTAANLAALETAFFAAYGTTGLKGYNLSGSAADGVGMYDVGATATQVRLVAGVIDASAEASDVTVRVGTTAANTNGGQKITMGSGNDTVIFDDVSATSATRGNAGLTNADTVSGGTGNNTLVIDGHGVNVVLQQSEWDNVSGFQTVYLAGNGNQYFLQIDNDMVAANGTNGNMITIDNDNDSTVSTTTNTDARVDNTAVRLDATTLSASMHFTYDGEEGSDATADRFVVNDQNTNGGNIIDGGDVDVVVGVDASGVTRQLAGDRSLDVLEVRNTATVTTADLANVSNVGTIVINNDQAVLQTLNLTLNTAVADALSDAGHTASLTETEALVITANDGLMTDAAGTAIAPTAASRISLDARGISGAFGLTIAGDTAFNANDVVNMQLNLAGAAQAYNLAGGTDTVSLYGFNTNGTDTVAVTVSGNVQTLVASSATGLSTQTFTLTSVETLNYLTSAGVAATVGGSTFTGGALADTISGSNLADVITGGAGADNMDGGAGNDTFVVAAIADFAAGEVVTGGANADILQFGAAGAITYVGRTVTGVETLDLTAGATNAVVVTQGTGLTTVLDLGVALATLTLNQGTTAFGAAAQATAGAVDVAGEWHYAAGADNGVLTYFDQTAGATTAITLVGVETGALTGGVATVAGNLVFTQA